MIVELEKATDCDVSLLLQIQKQAFEPLYRRYADSISPYLEELRELRASISYDQGAYYKIVVDKTVQGGVHISWDIDGNFKVLRIYIAPTHHNRGIAKKNADNTRSIAYTCDFLGG